MIQIWLVRHAESMGQTGESDGMDPDLSAHGRRQAERLREPLSRIAADTILLSPLKRAWQTFEISGATAPHIEFDSRLIEHADSVPSPYEKILPVETPSFARPDIYDVWHTHSADRATGLLNDLLKQEGKSFVLFGHNGFFGILCRSFIGIDPRQKAVGANMDNTAISLLAKKDSGRHIIELWNDRAHVIDLLQDPYGFRGSYTVNAEGHSVGVGE